MTDLPKILDRLRKLLGLARGKNANDHERAAARKTADKLMAEHGLTEDDVGVGAVVEVEVPGTWFPVWRLAILQGCAKCCACILIHRTYRKEGDDQKPHAAPDYERDTSATCKLVGRLARVDETLYMYRLLCSETQGQSDTYPYQDRANIDSFQRGMAKAIQDRLKASDFARRTDDAGVLEYAAKFHADAGQMAPSKEKGDPDSYVAGYGAGMACYIPDPRKATDRKMIVATGRTV